MNSFLLNHIRKLSGYFDITVITSCDDALFLQKQGLDVKVISMEIKRKVQPFKDFFVLIKLFGLFVRHKPKAVHSITPKAGLLAMLAARICFIPMRVHTFTGQVWATETGLKRSFLKFIDKLIGEMTTYNLVDSPSQRDFLVRQKVLSEQKSIVFGSGSVSGVDLKRFMPNEHMRVKVRLGLGIPKEAFVFIYLGRLNQDKGILDLACAFANIQNSKAFLLIVGPDEGGFVNEIKKINVHKLNQIKFVDFTKVPEQYLAASNVLCLPSYREGFGNVVIEAAAMGVPAIASNIYGISDAVVDKQTGLLHTAADVSSLLFCFITFLNDPELVKKYGDAAKLRVVRDFNAKLITADRCQFYPDHLYRI